MTSDCLQQAIFTMQKVNRRDYPDGVEGQEKMLSDFKEALKPLSPGEIKTALGTLRPESARLIRQWLGDKEAIEPNERLSRRGIGKMRDHYGW